MLVIAASIKWAKGIFDEEGFYPFLLAALAALVGIASLGFFCAWLLMLAWNWSGVGIFHQHAFTYWQSLGLLILCIFLFWFVQSIATAIKK